MKKKRMLMTAVCFSSVVMIAGMAYAGGQDQFLQSCGGCHKSGGQTAAVNPADKAGRVWKKYFARGRHPVDMGIADGDLETVISYLVDHAADSDQPAAAVIPK